LNKEVEFLSGGNQQKCVVAKWLCSEGNIIILDEPTRGIDIGSKVAIYKIITDLARRGAAILLISSDLTEIMGLSHRILVMDHGMKKLEIQTDETDLKTIMKYCLGENGSKKGLAAND
jgi:ABC-type sugar transport system ATPase subunit